jgi:general secretion pathway protein G
MWFERETKGTKALRHGGADKRFQNLFSGSACGPFAAVVSGFEAVSKGTRSFHSSRPRLPRGFSLIEMTAVLALMAILAGIVTVNVRHHLIVGKQNAAKTELSTISDALEAYYSQYGRYPTNEEGLAVLSQRTDKLPEPLLKQAPLDPWGHPYQYNRPGRNGEPYEVVCFGADGREGGEGADADIYSWNLKATPGVASSGTK